MSTGRVPTTANSPLTAKGDLFGYSTTQARVAVGSDGDTLVADSAATTGLRWQGNYAAGKNKIINGDFGIWQRGTTFSITSAAPVYTSDRWNGYNNGNGTITISRENFTAGSAPVAGYESTYFCRFGISTVGTSTAWLFRQFVEDVRTFAGQTVTFSFWAKTSTSQTISLILQQNFGSGGSSAVNTTAIASQTLTGSWVRYSATVTLPSISGKTLGTNHALVAQFNVGSGGIATGDIDFWGMQLEAGSVATAFQTATGTLQGELAACERYYFRNTMPTATFVGMYNGFAYNGSTARFPITLPTTLRAHPTSLDTGNIAANKAATDTRYTTGTWSITSTSGVATVEVSYTHGSSVFTAGENVFIQSNNVSNQYIGFSAEL
jgi:hypothetical protein